MKIINKKIEDLKPYENNPRNNDDAIESVANSIKEFGFKVPIIIDKNNIIIAGHTRYKACQKLEMKEVPCVVADDLTDEQIKAFRIADNKVGEIAFWDNDALVEELKDIDLDMSDFGFSDFELNILMGDYEPDEYDDEMVENYEKNASNYLKKNRVVINYTDEEAELVKTVLGVDNLKVLYDIKELVENGEDNTN